MTRSRRPRPSHCTSQDRALKQTLLAARINPDARNSLAGQLGGLCSGWLRPLYPDPNDLDDATQVAVLHVIDQLHAYDGRRRALPWARTVATRKGLDHRAALGRRRARLAPAAVEEMAARPDDRLRDDEKDAIHAALGRLSPSDRSLIYGRFWRDQILDELAQEQQVALATVHRRIGRALVQLRTLLARPLGIEPMSPAAGD
jgi:RNA polymerase sigma factor (sigma-70 family)